MNEHQEINGSPAHGAQLDESDRLSVRRQRIQERRQTRAVRHGASWVGGAILIAVGIFLLLQNLISFSLENWWALFILIPAVAAFANSWRVYQSSKCLSAPARASLIGGILLTMIAAMFLFDLNWTVLGPVLIVLAGLGLLINVILPG